MEFPQPCALGGLLMLAERGVEVAHAAVFRWLQSCAPKIEKGSVATFGVGGKDPREK